MEIKSKKVVLKSLIKVTAGGRHAWYSSNVGDIRKPIQDKSKLQNKNENL